ncbi:MAG: nucleoside phosphorylase [Thermomicrobiales bacterium]
MTIVDTFDDMSEEVIRVSHVVKPIDDFPATVIVTYSRLKFEYLLQHYPCDRITTLNSACAPIPIYRVEVDGESYAAYLSLIGGPAAVGIMEEVIGFGARRFLFFGSCGVMDNDILTGHVAVPTAAYRDEGTSYHYLAPSAYVHIPTAELLAEILQDLGVPYHLTRTWTTDAIYRETRGNMAKRKAEGCRVVDMECASTAAAALFRGVEFYQFLFGSDSLAGDEWDPRDLLDASDEEGGAIVDIAFKIAKRLA